MCQLSVAVAVRRGEEEEAIFIVVLQQTGKVAEHLMLRAIM